MLRARDESFGGSPDKVRVINLLDHAAEGRVQLQAHHTARGQLATGITFTALSGMGMITGITLTGTGYGFDHDTMGKAGIITMVVSAPLLAGSIWLILDSRARAEVVPFDGGADAAGAARAGPTWSGARTSSPARSSRRNLAAAGCRVTGVRGNRKCADLLE